LAAIGDGEVHRVAAIVDNLVAGITDMQMLGFERRTNSVDTLERVKGDAFPNWKIHDLACPLWPFTRDRALITSGFLRATRRRARKLHLRPRGRAAKRLIDPAQTRRAPRLVANLRATPGSLHGLNLKSSLFQHFASGFHIRQSTLSHEAEFYGSASAARLFSRRDKPDQEERWAALRSVIL
jgi:hypothetical protein